MFATALVFFAVFLAVEGSWILVPETTTDNYPTSFPITTTTTFGLFDQGPCDATVEFEIKFKAPAEPDLTNIDARREFEESWNSDQDFVFTDFDYEL